MVVVDVEVVVSALLLLFFDDTLLFALLAVFIWHYKQSKKPKSQKFEFLGLHLGLDLGSCLQ